YDFILHSTSYFGVAAAHQHVHFAADPKFRQINPGLNGKAAVRQNPALVVYFEIVHVGAIRVNFGSDRVSRSMNKFFSEPCFGDAFAYRIIHLPSGNLFSGSDGVLHEFSAGIARIANDSENLLNLIRRSFSDITDPSDVVIHGVRNVLLSPDVEKNEVSVLNWL